ncbi:MAG: hypothetical protein AAFY26_02295 [Cyanobacteria bacterium J06638_22]
MIKRTTAIALTATLVSLGIGLPLSAQEADELPDVITQEEVPSDDMGLPGEMDAGDDTGLPGTEEDFVDDMPMEDMPMEDMPMEDMPMEDTPTEDMPMEDMPMEDMPMEEEEDDTAEPMDDPTLEPTAPTEEPFGLEDPALDSEMEMNELDPTEEPEAETSEPFFDGTRSIETKDGAIIRQH